MPPVEDVTIGATMGKSQAAVIVSSFASCLEILKMPKCFSKLYLHASTLTSHRHRFKLHRYGHKLIMYLQDKW